LGERPPGAAGRFALDGERPVPRVFWTCPKLAERNLLPPRWHDEKRPKSRDRQTASPASRQPQPQQVQPKGDVRKEQAVADDWEDMNTGPKLNRLRSAVDTLERRQDDLLRYVGELADAVAAMELKLRQ
jgi:hypothetical protein